MQSHVSLRLVNFMQVYKICWIPISSSQRLLTPSIATPIFVCQFGWSVCVRCEYPCTTFLVRFSVPSRSRPSPYPPPSARSILSIVSPPVLYRGVISGTILRQYAICFCAFCGPFSALIAILLCRSPFIAFISISHAVF
jgi:hypothetical protein